MSQDQNNSNEVHDAFKALKLVAEWQDSKMDPFVYQHGISVGVSAVSCSAANDFVQTLTETSGYKHDYHMFAGRVVIKKSPVKIGETVFFNSRCWFTSKEADEIATLIEQHRLETKQNAVTER